MKKKNLKRNAKTVVAASLVALPMLSSPGVIYGQKGAPASTEMSTNKVQKMPSSYYKFSDIFVKLKGDLWLAGVGDGHTIYQKENGEMFYIDPSTGDMKLVSTDAFHKSQSRKGETQDGTRKSGGGTYIKIDFPYEDGVKGSSKVKLLGVDDDGNVVHQKPNGDKFTVNKKTGHVTLLK